MKNSRGEKSERAFWHQLMARVSSPQLASRLLYHEIVETKFALDVRGFLLIAALLLAAFGVQLQLRRQTIPVQRPIGSWLVP
jgi:hypothetical protein